MVVIFSKGPSICYFNPFRLQEGVFPDGPTILCHTPLPSSTPSPFETPFKILRRLRVFKCYYVWCRFCIQYLCQRHEEWQDLFRFCFHCCKDLHHFFFWGNRWPSYVCDYIGNNVHSFFVWSPTQNIFAYISSIPK